MDITKYKKIHCIGIGGIGLSAIAEILSKNGYIVSGSDMQESEMTDKLRSKGIKISIGHNADNIGDAELIIYSAAIGENNPELLRAREKNLPTLSRAEVLGILMQNYENSIAISGTHGKTTTTSMLSLILENANLDPTILVGGNLSEIGGNVKVGSGDYFITEACEYMDSFLNLRPKIEVILNIDSDHLDYFKDIEHIVKSFEKFAELLPENGKIIAYDANPFVKKVITNIPDAITFGYGENCTYYAKDIAFDGNGMPSFTIMHTGENLGRVQLSVPGEHNILNAMAAFACCHTLGVDPSTIITQLKKYTGTERRFDVIGVTKNGVKIVDDYAHHPTEIKATITAAKKMDHRKLWVIFQPHTYTRTLALFDEFKNSFDGVDVLIFPEIYAAREKNIYRISSQAIADAIKAENPKKNVHYMEKFEDVIDYVDQYAEEGDLVITMGAGDVFKIGEMILNK